MSAPRFDEVAIVGGGPAGSLSATLLAQSGRRVLLLERDREPRHKICGEFISIEAQGYLEAIGIRPEALGGQVIDRVRFACGDRTVEAALPFEGIGLTRRTLDEAMLRRAQAAGVQVERGTVVRSIDPLGEAFELGLDGGRILQAGTVFLATGKHDLPAHKRPPGRSGHDLVGFKTYWSVSPAQRQALDRTVEIILFPGGYAGLQCVEDNRVNLCLLVSRSAFHRAGRTWPRLLDHLRRESPHLRQRLEGAEPALAKPVTISNVPYGFTHQPSPGELQGMFRLGDQMGVIPSFCGDGIAIALHTAHLAAQTYLARGQAASVYHARARADIKRQIALASSLYDLSVTSFGRGALMAACRLYPGLLAMLARRTRLRVATATPVAAPVP